MLGRRAYGSLRMTCLGVMAVLMSRSWCLLRLYTACRQQMALDV